MKVTTFVYTAGLLLFSSLTPLYAGDHPHDDRPRGEHPHYLQALSDLRAARWLIDHRPGNWRQTTDEVKAVRQIDEAIAMIKHASIDDRKDINDHLVTNERPDRAGRLYEAVEYLEKAAADVNLEESNTFASGLKDRSLKNIFAAIITTRQAVNPAEGSSDHPHFLHALSNLRSARWLISHHSGNWRQTADEDQAVRQIDEAISIIKRAAIDDGKDINNHAAVDERPDRAGRLREAADYLNKAAADVNREEDKAFANHLRDRAIKNIAEAIGNTWAAMKG